MGGPNPWRWTKSAGEICWGSTFATTPVWDLLFDKVLNSILYTNTQLYKIWLYWARVQFKLLLFVYKSLHNQSPSYIKDLLSLNPATNYALHSSAQSFLFVPKVNCSTLGDRAFAHAAPVLWNSLPLTIRTSSSLAIFKKQLKTFLFKKAFNLLE